MFEYLLKLPILCQVNIIAYLDDSTLQHLIDMIEFNHLFGKKSIHSENIYREKTLKYYHSDFLKFKTNSITWKSYYYSLVHILDNLDRIDDLVTNFSFSLYKYQILRYVRPTEFKQYEQSIVDHFTLYDNIEIMKWLKLFPTDYYIFLAVQDEHMKVLEYLHENDFEFNFYHFQLVEHNSRMFHWFSERNYVVENMWNDVRREHEE